MYLDEPMPKAEIAEQKWVNAHRRPAKHPRKTYIMQGDDSEDNGWPVEMLQNEVIQTTEEEDSESDAPESVKTACKQRQ